MPHKGDAWQAVKDPREAFSFEMEGSGTVEARQATGRGDELAKLAEGELRWYVLRSKPHKESTLASHARACGHTIFYPTLPTRPVNPRAARQRPYFPGYLFVRAELSRVGESAFRWMPYSGGLVYVGGEAAPVPDLSVRAIAARVEATWKTGGLPPAIAFDRGDGVVIREGMFEGYEAIFDARLPGRARVRVLLRMLNDRYVPVEIDVGLIEKNKPSADSHQPSVNC